MAKDDAKTVQTVPATANQKAMPISQSPKTNGIDFPLQYSSWTIFDPHPAGYAIKPKK